MNVLYIMVGIPASGKSFAANVIASEVEGVVVSRDSIRFSFINENDGYFSREAQVFLSFVEEIQSHLDKGETVIADATHLTEGSRKRLINNLNLKNTSYIVPVVMNTSLSECLKRNDKRKGRFKVPSGTIKDMYYFMTDPADDCAALKELYYDVIYIDEEN